MTKKGMRKGVNKKDILKSLSDDDKARIRHWKEVEEKAVKNDNAYKCGVYSDQLYVQFSEKINLCYDILHKALFTKKRMDNNKIEIETNTEINRKDVDTGKQLTRKDLEIENIKANSILNTTIMNLRSLLFDIYRYVGVKRIDGQEFFTEEDYNGFVEKIKKELKTLRIDLYKEAI